MTCSFKNSLNSENRTISKIPINFKKLQKITVSYFGLHDSQLRGEVHDACQASLGGCKSMIVVKISNKKLL
ncbi:MAG: hypothetical protein C4516_00390 [Oxalobacter sp.]|nr:MAG: hypothetical protein C4516_00390 [Oxalobacter sp.]